VIRDKRIVVAVLDWGLGHATRSTPIIRDLTTKGNTITIASSGLALRLLKDEFPHCHVLELPSYNIRYASSNMAMNMLRQAPKILRSIKAEHSVLHNFLKDHPQDVILSDNRYGCYSPSLQNIFISHQLNLKAPFGARLINYIQSRWLKPFQEIWVPDDEHRTLSGDLSDPTYYPNKQIRYIGPQSRLNKVKSSTLYDIAVILSGPEPQRTNLEDELLEQLNGFDLKSIVVRGSKNPRSRVSSSSNFRIAIQDVANAQEISEIISGSKLIVARSGYSTIMDMAKLGGKALFIPTPGQTEQVYLARRLKEKGIADFQKQGYLDIQSALSNLINYTGW